MDLIADVGTLGIYLGVIVVTLLAVLLPMSAYAAQKWAHKTYLEVRSMNRKLTELLELLRADQPDTQPEVPPEPMSRKRREPTLGGGPR
jgi:hypothetical protein